MSYTLPEGAQEWDYLGSGKCKKHRTNFFSLSYTAKFYIKKRDIVKDVKPHQTEQSSAKSLCSSHLPQCDKHLAVGMLGKW